MKNTLLPLLAFVNFCFFSSAFGAKIGFEIEPVVGYERVQKVLPTPHTTERVTYGALVTAGFPVIAIEAEYMRGQDTENFPLESLTVKDTADYAKVGLRWRFKLSGFLSAWIRAGAEARRTIQEITISGVTTREEPPIDYSPYAGAGFRARLSRYASISAGVTVVFQDFPDSYDKNHYMFTLGFQIALGNAKRRRY